MREGTLTIEELSAFIEYAPSGSPIWAIEHGLPYGWSLESVLLSDLFAQWSGEEHPARAEITEQQRATATRSKREQLLAQRERLAQRKE